MKLPQNLVDLMNAPRATPLSRAVEAITDGWAVFPLAPRSKEPYEGSGGVYDATRDWGQIERWIATDPDANLGGATDGFLVIDVDVRNGGKRPPELQTRFHASGRGDGGGHLIYRLTAEQREMGFKSGAHRLGPGLDIKTGAGNYVVLPPSIHPDSGRPYESDHMPIQDLPDAVAAEILKAQKGGGGSGTTSASTSLLSTLLNKPPEEGGRNEWLAKVCGHLAKQHRKMPDLYWTMVAMANERLDEPLDEAEVEKTANSIWNAETSGHPDREFVELLNPANGWLAKGEREILQAILDGPKDATVVIPDQFADFDLELLATLLDVDTQVKFYHLRMILQTGEAFEELVPAATFSDARLARRWFVAKGGTVAETPERPRHKGLPWPSRVSRYISSQEAPRRQLVRHLGWSDDDGAFLSHTHRIDAEGAGPYRLAQPSPLLKDSGSCNYEYGMQSTWANARRVLAEVMTFHDETTMAAFGAWWAANLAKQWLQPLAGMFPMMAIEAASESGKTDGAFGILVRLSGNQDSSGFYTNASLRDVLASNRNGIVWIDDTNDPSYYFETIRALTGSGTLSKKAGENFERTERYRLVGSLLMSGEALGLEKQKALLDRVVQISPPSPTGRMSLKPGRENVPQYQDLLDLRAELLALGGEQAIAGHYLARVAGWREQVERAYAEVRRLPGRSAARDNVMRVGARVLDAMIAESQEERSAAWAGERPWARLLEEHLADTATDTFKGDNKLTLELLPWALSHYSMPQSAHAAGGGIPAFVEEEDGSGHAVVWFSPRQLAKKWYEHHHGKIDNRLDTQKSIENQAKQIGLFGTKGVVAKLFRVSSKSEGARTRYWQISGEIAEVVIKRAEG